MARVRWGRSAMVLCAVALGLASTACQAGERPAPAPSTTAAPAPGGPDTSAPAPSTRATGFTAPLDRSVRHASGLSLKLTAIAVAEDSISLEVVVTNGAKLDLSLNNADDLVLVDDRGARYTVSPPGDNRAVTVRRGTTLRGRLVFVGQLDPETTSLTLVANSTSQGDPKYSAHPKIELPGIPVRR
ncbi:MAG TPA: hypothetical protein VG276_15065 [Actinomycetes bacterium]|nr:hypothetical protein [Actinomycetes bacterium]